MDRDQLKAWLEQGLSLIQIGALTNRDPSTVGYWVQKHGLVANGRDKYAPRGGLARERLEPLVAEGLRLREIAERLGISISTVGYWLKKYDLKTLNRRGPRPRLAAVGTSPEPEITAGCPHHGLTTFFLRPGNGSYACKRCRSEAVAKRRRRVKEILVHEAGGRCRICGYARFQGALEFHHIDPSKKSFALSRKGVTIGIDVLRKEAAKCILLCSNCHAEVEAGVVSVP